MEKEELTQIRHAKGWTQARLAKVLGVSPAAICRWEKGNRVIPPYIALLVLYTKH
jgi:transcriptional regulator with XRE-family HTH domain